MVSERFYESLFVGYREWLPVQSSPALIFKVRRDECKRGLVDTVRIAILAVRQADFHIVEAIQAIGKGVNERMIVQ